MLNSTDGPGCGHDLCLFERHCIVLQAEIELLEARADRAYRLEKGLRLARSLGLGAPEGRLFEVVLYSPDLPSRVAAGELLSGALRHLAADAA